MIAESGSEFKCGSGLNWMKICVCVLIVAGCSPKMYTRLNRYNKSRKYFLVAMFN
jgi:hypothetical protein